MSKKFNYLYLSGITIVELGSISEIDQYVNAHNPTKFGACIKNRNIQELCR